MNTPPELSPEIEAAIQKYVASRCKVWSLWVGIPSLLVLLLGLAMVWDARRSRADVVRFGMPLEIHNPAWGTVLDGVDPAIFPGRDPRDIRRGTLVQQYVPLGNDQQAWELRRRTAPNPDPTPAPPAPPSGLEPLQK
jgi:hypothetical protein